MEATEQQPPAPRRLYRSRSDRMLGGVCGGIGQYFGIDAIIVRIVAVVLLFLGGASALAYLAALVLVPNEPPEGAPPPPARQPRDTGTIVALVALVVIGGPILLAGSLALLGIVLPLALLVLAGLLVWWLVSGEGAGDNAGEVVKRAAIGLGVLVACTAVFTGGAWAAGIGGGTLAAGLVIGAGVVLAISAFAGGFRMLILPALALAMGVGLVSAANVDLHGGLGQREYKPASASDLHDRYQLGMGQLVVDLREARLPKGDTPVRLKVGVGDALVLVPRDVCVASKASIGAGGVDFFDRDTGGLDVEFEDRRPPLQNGSRVILDADVGLGALEVRHDRRNRFDHRFNDEEPNRNGCGTARA